MLAFAACFGMLWLPVYAQEIFPEGDDFADLPVALSASRLSQPVNETPTAVTVIDRDMIRASGAIDLPDVLRLVPGMVVGYPVGSRAALSYHGLSSSYARRMQVLIDGRTIYEPSVGGVNWSNIPLVLDDVERIEVVRGTAAASHGANAFLGVISITTRAAAAQKGIEIDADAGSSGIKRGLLRFGQSGDNFDYRVTAERRGDTGFRDVTDDYLATQVTVRGDLRRNARDLVSASLGFGDTHTDEEDAQVPRHVVVSKTRYEQFTWRHTFSPLQELTLQMYHNYVHDDDAWATNQIAYERDATKERYDAELEHRMTFDGGYRLVWGGGARRDEVTDASAFNTQDTQTVSLYRVFSNLEARLGERLVTHVGAMWESNDLVGRDLSPRLAVNYHLTPNHTLRAGYGRAYRNPVLAEERGDLRLRDPSGNIVATIFRSSGGLAPEQIDSYEIGYVGTALDRSVSVDVKLYRDKVGNLIRTIRNNSTGVFDFRNLDSAEISGAEVEAVFQRQARQRIYLSYSYEDIDSENVAGKYTVSAPRHKVSLLAMQHVGDHYEASARYTYVGEMEWLGTRDSLESYDRVDLRLAYSWKRNNFDGEIAGVIQGLGGKYADFISKAEFEQRAFLTLKFHFL